MELLKESTFHCLKCFLFILILFTVRKETLKVSFHLDSFYCQKGEHEISFNLDSFYCERGDQEYLFLYLFGSQKRENIQFHKGKNFMRNGSRYESLSGPSERSEQGPESYSYRDPFRIKFFFLHEIVYSPNLRYKQVERQFYDMTIYAYIYHVKLALSVNVKRGGGG